MSGIKWKHWCPNECGKQAVYMNENKRNKSMFKCEICGWVGNKDELG